MGKLPVPFQPQARRRMRRMIDNQIGGEAYAISGKGGALAPVAVFGMVEALERADRVEHLAMHDQIARPREPLLRDVAVHPISKNRLICGRGVQPAPFTFDTDITAKDRMGIARHMRGNMRQPMRVGQAIGVQKGKHIAPCLRRAKVACGAGAGDRLVDQGYPWVIVNNSLR